VLTQSLTPSQLPDRVFKRQGSFRGAPRYVQIAIPQPEQLPCEVFVIDGETYVPVQVVNEPDWAGDANLPPIDDAVEAKRARLLAMQSATFHYLDAAGVREVYAQEMAAAGSAPASGINPMDEPWLTQPDTATTPAGEPAPTGEPSPEAMFLAYQRRIIAKNEAVLDLEFEHRKPEALIQLDRVLRWLKHKHPAVLAPEPGIRKTRERIAREETGKQMDRLRSGGRAIIHAAFAVSHPQPEVARLSLLCPATYCISGDGAHRRQRQDRAHRRELARSVRDGVQHHRPRHGHAAELGQADHRRGRRQGGDLGRLAEALRDLQLARQSLRRTRARSVFLAPQPKGRGPRAEEVFPGPFAFKRHVAMQLDASANVRRPQAI